MKKQKTKTTQAKAKAITNEANAIVDEAQAEAQAKADAEAKAKHIEALKLRLTEKGQIPEINALISNLVATHQAEKLNATYAIEAGALDELNNCMDTLRANTNRTIKALNALYNNVIMDNNAIKDLMKTTGMDIKLAEFQKPPQNVNQKQKTK